MACPYPYGNFTSFATIVCEGMPLPPPPQLCISSCPVWSLMPFHLVSVEEKQKAKQRCVLAWITVFMLGLMGLAGAVVVGTLLMKSKGYRIMRYVTREVSTVNGCTGIVVHHCGGPHRYACDARTRIAHTTYWIVWIRVWMCEGTVTPGQNIGESNARNSVGTGHSGDPLASPVQWHSVQCKMLDA